LFSTYSEILSITKMSLWVDKYRPKSLAKLDYHLDLAENLKKLVKNGDFPHLLVYGPPGAGKNFILFLRKLGFKIDQNLHHV